jgi:hypothetical protein
MKIRATLPRKRASYESLEGKYAHKKKSRVEPRRELNTNNRITGYSSGNKVLNENNRRGKKNAIACTLMRVASVCVVIDQQER